MIFGATSVVTSGARSMRSPMLVSARLMGVTVVDDHPRSWALLLRS